MDKITMKRRNLVFVALMSYLTLGIYVIYWLYKTRLELTSALKDPKAVPRVIILFIPMIVLVAVMIAGVIGITGNPGTDASAAIAVVMIFAVVICLLAMFGISLWWFYVYFRAVEKVTHGMEGVIMYIIWLLMTIWAVGPAWAVVAQYELNKHIDEHKKPHPHQA